MLLADGAAVPISSLKPGEKVLATNTRTGKTQAEPVTAVLLHHDTDLYDLTVKTARGTAVIDTTSSHLFWVPSLHQWVAANKLSKGEHLLTSNGTVATADGGVTPKDRDGWMWDLTVPGDNDHDFYIDVAGSAVLVHNDDGDSCMVGANGPRITSQEVGRGKGWRMDVENPNPGVRPGQLHYQDYAGNKYLYNFETGGFDGMPGRLAKSVGNDPLIQRAIARGLQYLGMG